MIRKIEKEKKRAEHLFYTSLKYTKTADLFVNLIKRWTSTIEETIKACLTYAKKKKMIKQIPIAPKIKIRFMKKIMKNEVVDEMMDLYEIFRNIDKYSRIAKNEFRKNVLVTFIKEGEQIKVDLDQLAEWEKLFEEYVKVVKRFLKSKK